MAADPTPSVEDVRSRLARMKQRAAQLGNPGTAEERRRLIEDIRFCRKWIHLLPDADEYKQAIDEAIGKALRGTIPIDS